LDISPLMTWPGFHKPMFVFPPYFGNLNVVPLFKKALCFHAVQMSGRRA
jgi:hypothetical protein